MFSDHNSNDLDSEEMFKTKYLKYKEKYLVLKSQMGSAPKSGSAPAPKPGPKPVAAPGPKQVATSAAPVAASAAPASPASPVATGLSALKSIAQRVTTAIKSAPPPATAPAPAPAPGTKSAPAPAKPSPLNKALTQLVKAGTSAINNMSTSSGSPTDSSPIPTSPIPTSPVPTSPVPTSHPIQKCIDIICPNSNPNDRERHHLWNPNNICVNCNCFKHITDPSHPN
jgi:hypothetical protein